MNTTCVCDIDRGGEVTYPVLSVAGERLVANENENNGKGDFEKSGSLTEETNKQTILRLGKVTRQESCERISYRDMVIRHRVNQ